jgi:hypothetical protein
LALPLNALLPKVRSKSVPSVSDISEDAEPPRFALFLLSFVFAATWFNSTAMAAHLPGLLEASGASVAVAIAAGALIGPAQVAARVLGFSVGLILLVQLDLPPQLIQLRLFALSLLEDRWHTSLLLCMAQATGS